MKSTFLHFVTLTCFIFTFSDCKTQNIDKNKNPSKKQVNNPILSDTLTIKNKSVIIYSPSKNELKKLIKTDPNLEETLSDFYYYFEQKKDIILKSGFTPIITASRFIKFEYSTDKSIIIDRQKKENKQFGCIVFDKKNTPIILKEFEFDDKLTSILKSN